MFANSRVINNLLTAAKRASTQTEVDGPTRKRLSLCASEVVLSGAWEPLAAAMATASPAVKAEVDDVLEHVVGHPVFRTPDGRFYNGRLFVIPVSQALSGGVALYGLPNGSAVEALLAQTLAPSGHGVLANRFFAAEELEAMGMQGIWELSQDLALSVGPGRADSDESVFVEPEGDAVSGLHFLVFLALAPVHASDAMLALADASLAVQSLTMMEAVLDLVSVELQDAGHGDIRVCLHLPQPYFYDAFLVDLAHEAFLFTLSLDGWNVAALEEGEELRVELSLETAAAGLGEVVVVGKQSGRVVGEYRFPVDIGDRDAHSEVCAAVVELTRPRGIEVRLTGALRLPDDVGMDSPLLLALMEAPTALQ
jgi:hypothetical protein